MEEINNEIGLTQILRGSTGAGSETAEHEKEKTGEHTEDI